MLGTKIRPGRAAPFMAGQKPDVFHLDAALLYQSTKIINRGEMDVGSFVPGNGQLIRDWHPPPPQQR